MRRRQMHEWKDIVQREGKRNSCQCLLLWVDVYVGIHLSDLKGTGRSFQTTAAALLMKQVN